jgi:serine protease AprX
MAGTSGGTSRGTYSSALRRSGVAALVAVFALAAPLAASAAPASGKAAGGGPKTSAFLPESLRSAAEASPERTFDVIVQGAEGKDSDGVAADVDAEGAGKGVKQRFATIGGVSAELTGKQLLKLAARKGIYAISEDAPMKLAGGPPKLYSDSLWPYESGVFNFWPGRGSLATSPTPAIAIVDSGIDASRADFGRRVVKQETLTSLTPNSPGDGRGHGTFVASIAAGEAAGHAGAAPGANLISLDVMDDKGMARTSDVIAACEWILRNKSAYGIRVANFSLHSSTASSFRYDPLDKAVEKLWFGGVVVVAAAGNYAVNGVASRVLYAPANDPFVITVGALDISSSSAIGDDFNAPWSAFGYTLDGFAKPDVGAPGRYMIGAVPAGSTMALERPDRIVSPGYMQMSGTSFAAPVVAGAAAGLLAAHPSWTPDQVKGALMATAYPLYKGTRHSLGKGQVNVDDAAEMASPPNPNLALNGFVVRDRSGEPVFDAASWSDAAKTSASWDAASWSDASWSDASWSDASWSDASWDAASWSDASWSDASWDAAYPDSIWNE